MKSLNQPSAFLQVISAQIKNENLDISSGSILSLLEVLRKNQQIMNSETTSEEIADSDLKISVEAKNTHRFTKIFAPITV